MEPVLHLWGHWGQGTGAEVAHVPQAGSEPSLSPKETPSDALQRGSPASARDSLGTHDGRHHHNLHPSATTRGPPGSAGSHQHQTCQQRQHGPERTTAASCLAQCYPPPPPPIIKTMAKYFIICSNYPQIVKHWQPAARPPRREGEEVSWGECCAVSLRAPKGCKMRLGTGAGIRPHHPNPLSATQEGSKPPAPWAGAAGKTPTQIPLFPFCQAVQPRVLGSQSSLLALHMPPWGLGTSKQLFSSKAHSATWIGAFGNVQSCLILIPVLHPPFSSSISILIPIFHAPPHPHPPSPPSIPMPYPKHRDKPGTPGLFVPSQPC